MAVSNVSCHVGSMAQMFPTDITGFCADLVPLPYLGHLVLWGILGLLGLHGLLGEEASREARQEGEADHHYPCLQGNHMLCTKMVHCLTR